MPSGGYGRKRKCERNFSLSSRVEQGIGILANYRSLASLGMTKSGKSLANSLCSLVSSVFKFHS